MNIVVTEPKVMAPEVRSALEALGRVSWGPFSDAELDDALADCNVLMVRLGRHIGKPLMAKAPKLRAIVTATTGLDHIDLAAAKTSGIRVISLRDCPNAIRDVSATAEHTFGLLLALLRHTPAAAAHVQAGGWDRDLFWGTQLRGKRLGIVGYGRIGAMMGAYGAAFGMDVVAFDRSPEKIVPPARSASFEELLRNSDIISIHATADAENRHLIDRRAVAMLKPGAVLLNTSRGSLVDEAALAEAVAAGRLLGVACDVLDGEEAGSATKSTLIACMKVGHNVLVTPHIGGATREAIGQAEGAVVAVLGAMLGSEDPGQCACEEYPRRQSGPG